MAAKWIIQAHPEPAGPFDLRQMQSLAATGQLKKEHKVKQPGDEHWRDAGRVMAFWATAGMGHGNSFAHAGVSGDQGTDELETSSGAGTTSSTSALTATATPPSASSASSSPGTPSPASQPPPARRFSFLVVWYILQGGVVFGMFVGSVLYEFIARKGIAAYLAANPGAAAPSVNYGSIPHIELMFTATCFGLILAAVIAFVVSIVRYKRQASS